MDDFIALGAFGSFCPPDLDVTPDNDPNSPSYNGYKDIKTMTLQDAMKLVWLFNSADFSGSVTASASANNSGSITNNNANPPIVDNYSSSVSDSYSYTWTTSTSTNPPTSGKVTTDSFEPQLRICGGGNFSQSDQSDVFFDSSSDGTSSNSRCQVSFSIDALGSGGQAYFVNCFIRLPKLGDIRRFINNGNFIGYGFEGLIFSCDMVASATASNTFPFSALGDKPSFTNASGFGSFFISCFTFENDIGQFAGEDSDALVEVGGIPLYAQCIGTTTTTFSDTDTRVRFSVNESNNNNGGTLNYNDESQNKVYNYSYNSSASLTGNMDFNGITFYS